MVLERTDFYNFTLEGVVMLKDGFQQFLLWEDVVSLKN